MTEMTRKHRRIVGILRKSQSISLLAFIAIVAITVALAFSPITLVPPSKLEDFSLGNHADVVLYNEQITLLYSDEAAGIGNYTDDAKEPTGWELSPSIFWDSDGDHVLEANESIGHAISPSLHFAYASEQHHFWPLHQSILQDPGDAIINSSGWISSPNIYYSKVEDEAQLTTVQSTISLLDGNSSFIQEVNITSSAPATLTDVDLILYLGIDINGPFNDIAFIDATHNNMLKAYDNQTGVWFGAYPNSTATGFEVSVWNDGPYSGDDLWQHTLSNSLTSALTASGDVEASLQFHLNEIESGQSKIVTLICSFAENESGLYAPELDETDVAIIGMTTPKTGCPPAETVGQGNPIHLNVTVENQGSTSETFNVTTYANTTTIATQQVTLNAGENQTLTFIWDTTTYEKGNYSISAEAEVLLGESDVADNVFNYSWVFVTLTGDVDADRDVDIFDIVRIAASYGSTRGEITYDPNSDVDVDDDVDIFDVVPAASNYGQNW
jgi:hypothetical protein